jgi:hypothetical protein
MCIFKGNHSPGIVPCGLYTHDLIASGVGITHVHTCRMLRMVRVAGEAEKQEQDFNKRVHGLIFLITKYKKDFS